MKPAKHWVLDHEAYVQICDTRRTLVARLGEAPDDFRALFLADVVAEIDPENDPELREHARRAHARRSRLGTPTWQSCAREHGLDVLLFNLCAGMQRADIGHAAQPALARRAAELSENPRVLALLRSFMTELGDRATIKLVDLAIAARAPALAAGRIERAFLPDALLDNPAVQVHFHASGHLATVRIRGDRRRSGNLTLSARPGTAHLVYTARSGGHGYVVDEQYRDGAIHSTLVSPWHDGDQATERMEWTRWVAEALASLERVVPESRSASSADQGCAAP